VNLSGLLQLMSSKNDLSYILPLFEPYALLAWLCSKHIDDFYIYLYIALLLLLVMQWSHAPCRHMHDLPLQDHATRSNTVRVEYWNPPEKLFINFIGLPP
jgi:hypothetical protein